VKTLRSEFSHNPLAVRRFFSEARAVNRIRHQNIVEITDFVEQPGGENYYIMELLQGTNLARVVDDLAPVPVPVPRAVGIMAQVAAALDAVHAAGIIHRDLKPDNVFLIERGGQRDFVKLLDFGVAKLIEAPDQISVHQTAAGQILGTPEYMSPEQASAKPVSTQTDVYSFGVMLYELVTGRRPLVGESFGEIVVKHLTEAPVPPRKVKGLPHEIPLELEDVILACLAKDPADRPQGMRVIMERLEAIADARSWPLASFTDLPRVTGRMAVLTPLRKPDPAVKRRAHGRWAALALGGLVAAVIAGVVLARGGDGDGKGDDAPAPAPVEPAPATVEIELVSTPPGAEVLRDGTVVGRTPYTFATEPSATTATFELRLAGFGPVTRAVPLDRRSRVDVSLVPVAAPPPPPTAGTRATPVAPDAATGKRGRGGKARTDAATGGATTTTPAEPPPPDRSDVLDPFAPN
jgi:hypothetical protein